MKLYRIKHALMRLSPEERAAGVGCLLIFFGSFMPWYSATFSADQKTVIENGFSGDLGVIGFVVFLLTILTGLYLMGENMHVKLPTFGYIKDKIVLFLMGQSAFLLLLLVGVYTKRSLDFTNAELRFGIYTALIGAVVGTFAMFAQLQKANKKEVEAFFGQSEDEIEEAEVKTEVAHRSAHKEEPVIESSLFEEDMMEESAATEEKVEPRRQAEFFTREAGVGQEEKPKTTPGFYEDEL